jgi:surface antigen
MQRCRRTTIMFKATLPFALSAAALALAVPSTASAAFSLGSLYSCDAAGSSNTTGAVVGGIVGGLVGAKIAKNDAVGAVIGAGLGSALGNNVGCRMDRKASVDAQTAFQRALDTGKPQSWSDPANGIKGKIEVLGPATGGNSGGGYVPTAPWRFASGVTPVSRVSTQGGDYTANGRINVRAAPNTSAAIVRKVQPGEPLRISGAAPGGWLAVEDAGYVQGYVASSVVRPSGGGGGYGGDCRLVRQTINERGQAPVQQQFNACRDSRGEWQLTTV